MNGNREGGGGLIHARHRHACCHCRDRGSDLIALPRKDGPAPQNPLRHGMLRQRRELAKAPYLRELASLGFHDVDHVALDAVRVNPSIL